jgi:IS1 family transposase
LHFLSAAEAEKQPENMEESAKFIKKYGLFYTDDWDAYQKVLPEERHAISDYKKDANHVERFNNTPRQRASRLVRKALSFSKSEENHYGAMARPPSNILSLNTT